MPLVSLNHTDRRRWNLKANKSDESERGYIIISKTLADAKKYEGCEVIPYGDIYPAIYRQVYGPESRRECEKWMAANCDSSDKAAS